MNAMPLASKHWCGLVSAIAIQKNFKILSINASADLTHTNPSEYEWLLDNFSAVFENEKGQAVILRAEWVQP